MTILVLLQKDLRINDNPALFYAAKRDDKILPVYIAEQNLGAASLWWRIQSFLSLQSELQFHGLELLYHEGPLLSLIQKVSDITTISDIYWNDDGDAYYDILPKNRAFDVNLLFPPYSPNPYNSQSKIYKIFTPFWRHCLTNLCVTAPLPATQFKEEHKTNFGITNILPKLKGPSWWDSLGKFWQIGEQAATARWKDFQSTNLSGYDTNRDLPAIDGTSRLSPHLHFGEISVRQIWEDLDFSPESSAKNRFMAELGWREFSYHLLHYNKNLPLGPLQEKFKNFPWQMDEKLLKKWQTGQTGYPIIDAGMRQLWQTGWMHNRVRMIVASFLTKNLLIPWQEGAAWFLDTLVDADLASNSASWQWVAGCGTDAAPYFRIFNPVLQGQKFDPEGKYIRKWVPELANMDNKFIHDPWRADPLFLSGIKYPRPIIDLEFSRRRALESYSLLKP